MGIRTAKDTTVDNMFSLADKTAVVTGGAQGIGLMISRGLVQSGARVYVVSRKQATCNTAVEELSAFGTCIALPGDVSNETETKRLAAEIAEREGSLHVLVNNAGAAWGAPLDAIPTRPGTKSWPRM